MSQDFAKPQAAAQDETVKPAPSHAYRLFPEYSLENYTPPLPVQKLIASLHPGWDIRPNAGR